MFYWVFLPILYSLAHGSTISTENRHLVYVEPAVTWDDARAICTNHGMDLVVMNNPDVVTVLLKVLATDKTWTNYIWIGLQSLGATGGYIWSNGEIVDTSYQPWSTENGGPCVAGIIAAYAYPNAVWAKLRCTVSQNFLCQKVTGSCSFVVYYDVELSAVLTDMYIGEPVDTLLTCQRKCLGHQGSEECWAVTYVSGLCTIYTADLMTTIYDRIIPRSQSHTCTAGSAVEWAENAFACNRKCTPPCHASRLLNHKQCHLYNCEVPVEYNVYLKTCFTVSTQFTDYQIYEENSTTEYSDALVTTPATISATTETTEVNTTTTTPTEWNANPADSTTDTSIPSDISIISETVIVPATSDVTAQESLITTALAGLVSTKTIITVLTETHEETISTATTMHSLASVPPLALESTMSLNIDKLATSTAKERIQTSFQDFDTSSETPTKEQFPSQAIQPIASSQGFVDEFVSVSTHFSGWLVTADTGDIMSTLAGDELSTPTVHMLPIPTLNTVSISTPELFLTPQADTTSTPPAITFPTLSVNILSSEAGYISSPAALDSLSTGFSLSTASVDSSSVVAESSSAMTTVSTQFTDYQIYEENSTTEYSDALVTTPATISATTETTEVNTTTTTTLTEWNANPADSTADIPSDISIISETVIVPATSDVTAQESLITTAMAGLVSTKAMVTVLTETREEAISTTTTMHTLASVPPLALESTMSLNIDDMAILTAITRIQTSFQDFDTSSETPTIEFFPSQTIPTIASSQGFVDEFVAVSTPFIGWLVTADTRGIMSTLAGDELSTPTDHMLPTPTPNTAPISTLELFLTPPADTTSTPPAITFPTLSVNVLSREAGYISSPAASDSLSTGLSLSTASVDSSSVVVESSSAVTTDPWRSERLCWCPCRSRHNYSEEQKVTFTTGILGNLTINFRNLSSIKRLYVSAHDPRPSAKTIGGVGVVCIVAFVTVLLIGDIPMMFRGCKNGLESVYI